MSARQKLGMVVNAPGIQERRALALAPHLEPRFATEVLVRPSPAGTAAAIRRWQTVYVIDPGAAGFPAAALAKSLGRTTVVEVGDPQRELYATQGRPVWMQLVGGVLDTAVARHADGVVVRGEGLAATLDVRVPWVTIPDGVDLEVFAPTDAGRAIRGTLNIPEDALVVGVVGSIHWSAERSFAYGLDVIEAVAQLASTRVHVLIVGDGDGLPHLRQRASDRCLECVHFTGRVRHADVPAHILAMDVCVSTQSRDVIGHARTTAKLPEYLACDRFVLSTAVGTAASILPADMLLDSDMARWDDHVGQLRARLQGLVSRRHELRSGAGTRAVAIEHFSYPGLGRRLGDFLAARRAAGQARSS